MEVNVQMSESEQPFVYPFQCVTITVIKFNYNTIKSE